MSLCTIIYIFSSVKLNILEKMRNIIISRMDFFLHPSVPIRLHSTHTRFWSIWLCVCVMSMASEKNCQKEKHV